MSQSPVTVAIVRERDPLQGQRLRVLGRMRRGSGVELLVVLADGSKRLVPAAWTDLDQPGSLPAMASSSGLALGSVTDLLAACTVVAGLAARAGTEREQAARQSPAKEDHRAACPAQSAAADLSVAIGHAPGEPVPGPVRDAGQAAIGSARGTDDAAAAAGWAGGRGGRPDGPADRRGGHGRHGRAGGGR